MKKNNQMTLRSGVYSIVAVVVALAPFTTAWAADGIATGTIDPRNLASASPGQQASFIALQDICTNSNFSNDASFACSLTGGGIFSTAGAAANNSLQLQQFSPQAAMQSESIAITSPYQFIRNVNQQVQKLRDCQSSEKQQDTTKKRNSDCYIKSGGGSSPDAYTFIGPFGVSFSGGGGFGDRDNSEGQTGFKIDTRQANLMIDYAFNQVLTAGFAFNYLSTDRTLGLNSGTLNSDSYRFAPFLSYTPTSNSYVTLMGGYAVVDFDSTRSVSPVTNTNNVNNKVTITFSDATAKYNADQFFASLGAGYTHRMGSWSLRGYGRADYNHNHISSFRESGGIAGNFSYTNTVNGQSILSATTTLGAELSYAFSTRTLAAVIIPKLHAEWVHEFKNNGRQNQTVFNGNKLDGTSSLSANPSTISVAGPERNWANVGFGVQMLFPHAIVGYLNYDTLFIENASNQTVSGGFRINF
jgi:uncharacterized protein with beta-barrel porin domain